MVLEGKTAQGNVDIGSSLGPNNKGELKGSTLVFVRVLMRSCRSDKTKAGPGQGYRVYFLLLLVRSM